MIVPRAEVHDARTKAGDMKVVGVDTLDEALAALREQRWRRDPGRAPADAAWRSSGPAKARQYHGAP